MGGNQENATGPFRLRTRARISAHVIWDYIVRPTASAPDDVPWCAEAASVAWLTHALCRDHPEARVLSAKVAGGSDGSSIRRGITLTYNEAGDRVGLPRHLFVKVTPSLLTRLTAGLVAAREGAFYRRIRPSLPIETPCLYHTANDPQSGRSIHLFEDLTLTKQARFCQWGTVITRTLAEDMVELLATMHGTFYDSPRFQTDLAWLDTYADYARISARSGARGGHEQAMDRAAPLVPSALMARRDEIWPMLLAGIEAHARQPPTLLHSDVHLGNWYITGANRMGLCDWALVCRGDWARDLAYALSTHLAIDDRRAWERRLIEHYLDRLHAHGGPRVAFDEAWRRYRQQLFGALMMWTPTLCPSPTRPAMQAEAMSFEMIRRIATAIDDLDALDSHEG